MFLDNLHLINPDILGYWLCERQLPSGGLNGRPEKLPDACYSWWVFASLHMIGRSHWIEKDELKKFILACQVMLKFFQSNPYKFFSFSIYFVFFLFFFCTRILKLEDSVIDQETCQIHTILSLVLLLFR